LVGWLFKSRKLREHIGHAAGITVNAFLDVCIKFVTPAALVILLINDVAKELSKPYGDYSWVAVILIGRDWLVVALIASLIFAARSWRSDIHAEEKNVGAGH